MSERKTGGDYMIRNVGTRKCGRDCLFSVGVCVQSASETRVETVFVWAIPPLTNTGFFL